MTLELAIPHFLSTLASSAPPFRAATVLPALPLFHRTHCPVRSPFVGAPCLGVSLFRALFKASSFEGALLRRRRAPIEEESSQAPPFPPPLGQAVIHFSAAPLSTSQSSYSPRSLSSTTLSHATSSILGWQVRFRCR
ncbi:uncharacterized protein LOC107468731 isoform X2 [Arachis duranensis]|uniref:Uncharacterized protein LOC107468731 isoform X2 n=1 Tax=Arachis duranensis TaxID=130453 RepID=A0A6P4BV30_ARADU|nr:uncharacterized protein LOC107468731 isoform X2 [Arachis duranensis]